MRSRPNWLLIHTVMVFGCMTCLPPLFAQTAQGPWPLPKVSHPADNVSTPEKIELGKQLYFDPRLSSSGKVSCATCHDPEKGYSDGEPNSAGVEGQRGNRNSPTVINSAFHKFQFWDGRAKTLEEQALGPMQNPIEMGMKLDVLIERLNKVEGYRTQFQKVFGTDVTPENLAKAIAAFERTIVSNNSPYDRYIAGDLTGWTPTLEQGRALFFGKANCSACHSGANFTDNAFHNIGIGDQDAGRFEVSKIEGDRGAFKTPTVREVARTAPYMHDGSLKTLEEVVEHYNKGGTPSDLLDEEIFPLKLTAEEKAALVVFMREGLASPDFPVVKKPVLPQ
ncbi:MAG: cytochrome-c peroxidase [Planctomyces sp.]|nr:cytochrome-c peroxidase [Planctomyces sp.]